MMIQAWPVGSFPALGQVIWAVLIADGHWVSPVFSVPPLCPLCLRGEALRYIHSPLAIVLNSHSHVAILPRGIQRAATPARSLPE